MSIQEKFQQLSVEFQKLQSTLSTAIEAREKLEAQLSENEVVKKEFASLAPENTIYKLIGPVLVLQDQDEAKANVNTRLDFIKGEIKRIEAQIKETESKQERTKQEMQKLVSMQAALQQPAQKPPAQP